LAERINLKPSVPFTYSVEKNLVKCLFEGLVDGGTNEDWSMELHQAGPLHVCVIQRPNSYLFFRNFAVSAEGGSIDRIEVKNTDGKSLPMTTFDLREKKVSTNPDWNGGVKIIEVFLKPVKDL